MDIKMRMLWRFFAMAIVVSVLLGGMETANAEQAKAEEYRRILSSGKFYIEYSMLWDYGDSKINKSQGAGKTALAVDGDKMVSCTNNARVGESIAMSQHKSEFFKKIVKEMSFGNKLRPDVLRLNGIYYLFCGKNKALRTTSAEQFAGGYIHSGGVLSLPREFHALLPAMRNAEIADSVAKLQAEYAEAHPTLSATGGEGVIASFASEIVESGKKAVFGQMMNFDRYVLRSTSEEREGIPKPGTAFMMGPDGMPIALPDPSYEFYYDEMGNLRYIREVRELPPDLQAQQAAELEARKAQSPFGAAATFNDMYIRIDKISAEVPAELFEIPKGCAVYEIEAGTISDLLGEPTLVEQH